MIVLYPNLCYNKICHKGAALHYTCSCKAILKIVCLLSHNRLKIPFAPAVSEK